VRERVPNKARFSWKGKKSAAGRGARVVRAARPSARFFFFFLIRPARAHDSHIRGARPSTQKRHKNATGRAHYLLSTTQKQPNVFSLKARGEGASPMGGVDGDAAAVARARKTTPPLPRPPLSHTTHRRETHRPHHLLNLPSIPRTTPPFCSSCRRVERSSRPCLEKLGERRALPPREPLPALAAAVDCVVPLPQASRSLRQPPPRAHLPLPEGVGGKRLLAEASGGRATGGKERERARGSDSL
jgi:hypothetical protein